MPKTTLPPKPSALAYGLLENYLLELKERAAAKGDEERIGELDETLDLLRNFATLIARERRAEA